MKKRLVSMLTIFMLAVGVNAQEQEIKEPNFAGEVHLVRTDNSRTELEKHIALGRSVASTGLLLTGIGKVREQMQIEGCCSNTKIKKGEDFYFIVKNVDNNTDPLAVIKIFKFESKRKFRRAELNSMSSLGLAVRENNFQYVAFSGEKYGESSYLVRVSGITVGEYGVIVLNPNNLNQKQTIISSFAVVD